MARPDASICRDFQRLTLQSKTFGMAPGGPTKMGFSIKATATYTPRGNVGQFIAKVAQANREALRDVGAIVLLEAQAIVPVDTGELRDSGKVEVRETAKGAVADVIFDAAHASYVEFGTGIAGASSPGAGPVPYNPNWPGMPAQPFLRPAIDTLKANGELLGEYALKMRGSIQS